MGAHTSQPSPFAKPFLRLTKHVCGVKQRVRRFAPVKVQASASLPPIWISSFVAERRITSIVDLGCGDFRVSRRLCAVTGAHYTGLDVVPDLIAYNTERFGTDLETNSPAWLTG